MIARRSSAKEEQRSPVEVEEGVPPSLWARDALTEGSQRLGVRRWCHCEFGIRVGPPLLVVLLGLD